MDKPIISIYANDRQCAADSTQEFIRHMEDAGFTVTTDLPEGTVLLVCIGGDGTTLRAIHNYDFPSVPIVGVNTGHLGFFQELTPAQVESFITDFKEGRYSLQPAITVQATVETADGRYQYKGVNEIVIRGANSYTAHFDISIGESFIEKFSGDGILIATPSGSTAYNYSLGGSIVDPRLNLLQVTPIAPMNTTAYRSFTSSILLPPDLSLSVAPENIRHHETKITNDGNEHEFSDVQRVFVELSDTVVNLVRFENYDFWNKVKTKFL